MAIRRVKFDKATGDFTIITLTDEDLAKLTRVEVTLIHHEDGPPTCETKEVPLTQEEIAALPESDVNEFITKHIVDLEEQITNRRRDEFLLGADNGWFVAQRAKIETLRAHLEPEK